MTFIFFIMLIIKINFNLFLGVSINIHTNVTYITDSVSLMSLLNNKINVLLTSDKNTLLDTTIDWLNNHIYILMSSMTSRNITLYSIERFDLEQQISVEIVSGLIQKPFQIKVDPCNG